MNLFFSKCKFTTGLFYKRVDDARVEFKDGIFKVQILPYFNYSGHYHVHSVIKKTSNQTLYLTMKSSETKPDLSQISIYNSFQISLYHTGKKIIIVDKDLRGIILK